MSASGLPSFCCCVTYLVIRPTSFTRLTSWASELDMLVGSGGMTSTFAPCTRHRSTGVASCSRRVAWLVAAMLQSHAPALEPSRQRNALPGWWLPSTWLA